MTQRDPEFGAPGARRPPGDAPQFSPPGSGSWTPAGLNRAQPSQPVFDPTAPITGPGSPAEPANGPSAGGRGSGARGQGAQGPNGRPPTPFRPRRRLAPTLITVGVLLLALIVIGGGVLISRYRDQHASASTTPGASTVPSGAASPASSGSATPSGNSIPFNSRRAAGTLSVIGHRWTTVGRIDPTSGTYLALDVQVQVDRGAMYYSPEMFEAFDAVGNVYQDDQNVNQRPLFSTGYLTAGQQVRGWISFDLKRGETTLLLAGPDSNPMAALKVPG